MATQWYYSKDGRQFGPMSALDLKRAAETGVVTATDFVRKAESAEWTAAGSVKGLLPSAIRPEPPPSPIQLHPQVPPFVPSVKARPKPPETLQPPPLPYSHKSAWITPKRLAVAGGAFVCLIVIAALTSNERTGARRQTASSESESMDFRANGPVQNSQREDAAASSRSTPKNRPTTAESSTEPSGLPVDFRRQKKWPPLALEALPKQIAGDQELRSSEPFIYFSPQATYALVQSYGHNYEHDLRVWSVADGLEIKAKAPDCDYFSAPAAVSPNEKSMACLDGDLLRIWDLTSTPAILVQTIRLVGNANDSSDRRTASDVVWSEPSTIIIAWRGGAGFSSKDWTYSILRKENATSFSLARERLGLANFGSVRQGKVTVGTTEYDWLEDVVLSPNGRYLVAKAKTDQKYQNVVLVHDVETGRTLPPAPLPSEPAASGFRPLSQFMLFANGRPQRLDGIGRPEFENGSCFLFSPLSTMLAMAYKTEADGEPKTSVKLWKTDASAEAVVVTADSFGGGDVKDFSLRGFSFDDALAAFTVVRATRTSGGELTRRSIVVWDTATNVIRHSLDFDSAPQQSSDSGAPSSWLRFVAFTHDSKTLVAADTYGGYDDESRSNRGGWKLLEWDAAAGARQLELNGKDDSQRPASIAVSPDGRILASVEPGREDLALLWDIPHFWRLVNEVRQGDADWTAGNTAKAFSHYCGVLADEKGWLVGKNFPRLWSRCIDYYAEQGDAQSAEQVTAYAFAAEFELSPETASGKAAVEKYVAERNKATAKKSQEQREAREQKLAALRAKNQRDRVPASTLTRRQFIEKLRERMTEGRIEGFVTYAVFQHYAFHDSFGDPDTNRSFVDSQRLFGYRCRDGVIVLTVLVSGDSMVIVNDIDEL